MSAPTIEFPICEVVFDKNQLIARPTSGGALVLSNGDFPLRADVQIVRPRDDIDSPIARRWLYGTEGDPRPAMLRDEYIELTIKMRVPTSQATFISS